MATKKSDDSSEQQVLDWIRTCRDEAEDAKQDRTELNRNNFNMYHNRHDFSHKQPGQSREILSKQSMAVEQIASFFQQALADIGEWYTVEATDNNQIENMAIKPSEIKKIMDRQLDQADFYSHVGVGVKSGLLGALIITKSTGKLVSKPKFVAKKDQKAKGMGKKVVMVDDSTWLLNVDLVRQENFYPDPSGSSLYEIEDYWCDLYEIKKQSVGPDAIYDKAAVDMLSASNHESDRNEHIKKLETNQDSTRQGHRPKVKITEYWGTILDKTTGDILYENIVATMANDKFLIRKPTANPLWFQGSPYTTAPIIEVPNSVWPKALMDAPTQHNKALMEIYNLILDGAMKSVNATTQIRIDWLDDPSQVSDGIRPGDSLKVNSQAPPGAKVMEPVMTADVPNDALSVMNVVQQEFNAAALTNDLRQGVVPFRQVKATEVVEASQTITSVFQGIAKNIETRWIQRLLNKSWMYIAQNWDMIASENFEALFGKKRALELKAIKPQDVFVNTVNGLKFKVFGVSLTLSKQQDFRKLTTLLQTIGGSEVLIEEFVKQYDFGKLLGEIMTSLSIDKDKISIPQEQAQVQEQPAGPDQAGTAPDMMSQVPQAGSGSLNDIFGGPSFPQSEFPPSSAT